MRAEDDRSIQSGLCAGSRSDPGIMLGVLSTVRADLLDGQPTEGIARRPGNAAAGDVGKPSPLDDTRLRAVAGGLRAGMVKLVLRDGSSQGSGFVISRKHRLVATAGHVADSFFSNRSMWAFRGDTLPVSRVTRVWFHPRTVRKLDDGLYVRSFEPKDGEIDYRGPDMAVLQLSDLAAELSLELELANDQELTMLDGQPAGMLGFPGPGKTPSFPVVATFGSVQIGKSADIVQNVDRPSKERQLDLVQRGLRGRRVAHPFFS